jgi:hypothetical protein
MQGWKSALKELPFHPDGFCCRRCLNGDGLSKPPGASGGATLGSTT